MVVNDEGPCPRCETHRQRIDLQARELLSVQVRLDAASSRETALRSDFARLREQLARAEDEMRDAIKMGQSMSDQLKAAMAELDALKEKHVLPECLSGNSGTRQRLARRADGGG